jgi:L-alanine-DL-glutamate epimerase-like enolase superfamily enzyme
VLPDGPGLGVELDWDWIDNHTLEVIRSGSTAA